MRLTFPRDEILGLLLHAKAQWPKGIRESWGDPTPGKPEPGFWLVGDDGVYLMHNGAPHDMPSQPLVYARECNPHKLDFDDWWDAKRASFGGDDGVEFIDAATIERIIDDGYSLAIEFSAESMGISPIRLGGDNEKPLRAN